MAIDDSAFRLEKAPQVGAVGEGLDSLVSAMESLYIQRPCCSCESQPMETPKPERLFAPILVRQEEAAQLDPHPADSPISKESSSGEQTYFQKHALRECRRKHRLNDKTEIFKHCRIWREYHRDRLRKERETATAAYVQTCARIWQKRVKIQRPTASARPASETPIRLYTTSKGNST